MPSSLHRQIVLATVFTVLFFSGVLSPDWLILAAAGSPVLQGRSKKAPPMKSHAQEIKRVEDYKRRIVQQMRETIKELGESSGELTADILLEAGPEKYTKAISKIKRFIYDAPQSVVGTAEAVEHGNKALAFSEALEGLVTLINMPFDINPSLQTVPYFKYIKAVDDAVTAISIAENSMETSLLVRDLVKQRENLQNLDRALSKMREMEKAYQASLVGEKPPTSADTRGPRRKPPKTKDEPGPDDYSVKEALTKLEDKINAADPGPIYLDFESNGVRTETPPHELRGEALRKWLEKHEDFLRFVKEKSSDIGSRSGEAERPPADLLQPGREEELNKWIAKHPKFLQRVLGNDLPAELKSKAIELSDQEAFDLSQIPPGWIECQCPRDHPGLGIFIKDGVAVRQFHDPNFHCP